MSRIFSVHSFRGGTGKSNSTANLATLFAKNGFRVGVVDSDILSPGIHVLFGLSEDRVKYSLNDYLWGRCEIQQATYDVTPRPDIEGIGCIYLIPLSIKAGEIARIIREGYDVGLLNDGFQALIAGLNLDVLLIDTHPGLNEETLLSIAVSDKLIIVLRPDQQDYLGTGVTVEVARRLEIPDILLIVNKVPRVFDTAAVKERVEKAYNCRVAAVMPHSDEMMALASNALFVLRYPDHDLTMSLKNVMTDLLA